MGLVRRTGSLFALLLLVSPPSRTEPAAEPHPDLPAVVADAFRKPDGSLDVEAVVRHFENLYRSKSSIATAELQVVRSRRNRSLTMKIWTEGEDKALVVIQDPPREKGTATLKVDNNLWNYLPRIKRTIRIPPSMMQSPWMGSDFTHDDLVRESSYSKDYTYGLVGRVPDQKGWLIRFTARPGVVGLWERFDLVVSENGMLPLYSEWYNRKGELSRVMRWEGVKELGGKRLPVRMVLIPQDRDEEDYRTVMTYRELEFDAELPRDLFSLSQLERQR